MSDGSSLTTSVKQLNLLASSYADETAAQIKSIEQVVKSIVPPSEYTQLLQQKATESTRRHEDEDLLITELEKKRVDLVQDIQDQNATTARLIEMIGEYEELANALTAYSVEVNNHDTHTDFEDGLVRELNAIELALDANLNRTKEAVTKMRREHMESLTCMSEGLQELSLDKAQTQLDELIIRLNEATNYTK